MEAAGVLLAIVGIIVFVAAFIVDEGVFAAFGVLFLLLGGTMVVSAPDTSDGDIVTIQEIEYAINKCSSFGGLKEFRGDVIICSDKTEIIMNFEPEKKVETE